jgi:hypothetical protein
LVGTDVGWENGIPGHGEYDRGSIPNISVTELRLPEASVVICELKLSVDLGRDHSTLILPCFTLNSLDEVPTPIVTAMVWETDVLFRSLFGLWSHAVEQNYKPGALWVDVEFGRGKLELFAADGYRDAHFGAVKGLGIRSLGDSSGSNEDEQSFRESRLNFHDCLITSAGLLR